MREQQCEVLVVGAGPGGLAAAVTAAEHGARVVLVDDNATPGGQIWRASAAHGLHPKAARWFARARQAGVELRSGESVFGARGARELCAIDRAGAVTCHRGDHVILATGASERFLPFPGWTLPGVFGVGGLQALVKGGLQVAGLRVAVAGSGPLLLAVAVALKAHGARVVGIFEQASARAVRGFGAGLIGHPGKLVQALGLLGRLAGTPRHLDAWPLRAVGTDWLSHVDMQVGGRVRRITADFLACGFGLVPQTGLAGLIGCAIAGGRVVVDAMQRCHGSGSVVLEGVYCVGESAGVGGVDVAIAEGTLAGLVAVAADPAAVRAARRRRDRERRFAMRLERAFALRAELRTLADDDTIVCRCEDVPWHAVRNQGDARQAKLATRCGMGSCQGRVCGAALEFLCGFARDRVRPPLIPVPLAALAEP